MSSSVAKSKRGEEMKKETKGARGKEGEEGAKEETERRTSSAGRNPRRMTSVSDRTPSSPMLRFPDSATRCRKTDGMSGVKGRASAKLSG